MKTKLPKSWQPDERCFELMEARGLFKEWILHQLPGFREYWLETGESKKAWNQTFRNWVYRNWENVDKSRYHRSEEMTSKAEWKTATEDPKLKRLVPAEITSKKEALEFLKLIKGNLP